MNWRKLIPSASDRRNFVKIIDVNVRVFSHTTRRHQDTAGHAHPGPPHKVNQALLTIVADDGTEFAAPVAPFVLAIPRTLH